MFEEVVMAPRVQTMLRHAGEYAMLRGAPHVATEDLLLTLMYEEKDPGVRFLKANGLNGEVIYDALASHERATGERYFFTRPLSDIPRPHRTLVEVIQFASDEAPSSLAHTPGIICFRHLWVGLIQEPNGFAGKLLRSVTKIDHVVMRKCMQKEYADLTTRVQV